MVSSGQIFNIALIIVGGYVVITYGPQIITAIKKSMDDMKTAADAGGTPAGGDTTTGGAPGFMQGLPEGTPPFPEPGADTTTPQAPDTTDYSQPPVIPTPSYTPANSMPPAGLPIPQSTANTSIDPSGLIQQYPTVSSPQNPVKKKKSKSSSPTITKQQKQQEHLQNSQTSTGQPVPPPHVQVSQAHPSPAKVSTPTNIGHGIQSRFRLGTAARDTMDYQLGCNCVGKTCCFRGRNCDGAMAAECSKTSNTAHCNSTLRSQFLAKNQCNRPAKPKPVIGQLRSRFPPKPTTEMALNPTASFARAYKGYGIGDTGDIVSLDSLSVTIA